PGQRDPSEVERSWHRRPKGDLVLPPNSPAEVDAPSVPGWIESERAKRNGDLSHPAVSPDLGPHRSHRVPAQVDLASFVGDLAIRLRPVGIGDEHVAVLTISKGVEQDFEVVLITFV